MLQLPKPLQLNSTPITFNPHTQVNTMFSQTSDNVNNNSIINNLTEIILEIIEKVKNNPNIERENLINIITKNILEKYK